MRFDCQLKLLLIAVILLLATIALRPIANPAPVLAQDMSPYPFFVEPGYTMIRKPDGTAQMYGKVFIDMRTGDIWGFPTLNQSPYPVDAASTKPPKSHPMYLGQFVLSEAVR